VRVIILGIGNLLRSDDGVGLHVIEMLRNEHLGDNVHLIEGLSNLDILEALKGYEKIIIVDAMLSSGKPGTIYQLSLEDFKEKQTVHSFSTHLNMDFHTMLEFGKKLFPEKTPEDIIIIAVEAEDITTISDKCTPKVEQAIPKAVDIIKGLLQPV